MMRTAFAALLLLVSSSCIEEARAASLGGGAIGSGAIGRGSFGASIAIPSTAVAPIFDLDPSGGSSVPSVALTLNSVSMTTVLDCDARDIGGTNWACDTGGTFAEAGTGSSPTSGRAAPLTESAARAVTGVTGKYYERSATGSLDTDDYAFEVIARAPEDQTSERTVFSLNYGASAGPILLAWASAAAGVRVYSSVTNCGVSPVAANTAGAWYHFFFVAKRGAVGRLYANGVLVGSTAGACSSSDHDNAVAPLKIGAWGNSGTHNSVFNSGADIALVRVWRAGCTDCVGTSTNWDAVAMERFATVSGTDAAIAGGQSNPTTQTRATVASIDVERDGDGVRRSFRVGNGWIRAAKRATTTGLMVEPQATNLMLYSQALDTAASWSAASSTLTPDVQAAPSGLTTADTIIGNAFDTTHAATQAVTLTATTYTLSAWMKAGAQSFAYISDDTVTNADGYFDLSDCTAGTIGASATGAVEDWGNGWCRVAITFTGTAASHTLRLACAEADTDNTWLGDGATEDCYVWGAQVEAQPIATSYILTTTASATRNADDLRYSATNNTSVNPGTLEACGLVASHNAPAATVLLWAGASGADTNSVRLSQTSGDAPYSEGQDGTSATWQITGTGDVSDGTEHCLRVSYATNDVRFYTDGAADGTDVSAAMPSSFTNLFVGESRAAGSHLNGLITRVRAWDAAVAP